MPGSAPETVIVACARSPVEKAFEGSLREIQPDDLAAAVVRAALDRVPELDPAELEDLLPGARLLTTPVNGLRTHDRETGLATMCVGGGQGVAVVIERTS